MRCLLPGRRVSRTFVALGLAAVFGGCLSDSDPERPPSPPPGWPVMRWPADNPYSMEKARLGSDLFFDFRMSRDEKVSCGWCHTTVSAFTDNHHTPFSTGVHDIPTERNTPTLANVGFLERLMFDGAAASLEEQALMPLLNPNEMGFTRAEIESVLSADSHYVAAFRRVFGPGAITLERAAKALATYQRTILSAGAQYDAWIAGDSGALGPAARRGRALFVSSRAKCAGCHVPPLFTDGGFHDTGLDSIPVDSGRARVTGLSADLGRFKTPTLRNAELTPPYMHDGRFPTLAEVLQHYNRGGARRAGNEISPLGLSAGELSDLESFLISLTDNGERFPPQY